MSIIGIMAWGLIALGVAGVFAIGWREVWVTFKEGDRVAALLGCSALFIAAGFIMIIISWGWGVAP